MRRWILIGPLALLACVAAIIIGAIGVGELLSGAAPTSVDSLSGSVSSDFPVESVRNMKQGHTCPDSDRNASWR